MYTYMYIFTWNHVFWSNIDGTGGHHLKWNHSDTDKYDNFSFANGTLIMQTHGHRVWKDGDSDGHGRKEV